jgi:hypothetical protein
MDPVAAAACSALVGCGMAAIIRGEVGEDPGCGRAQRGRSRSGRNLGEGPGCGRAQRGLRGGRRCGRGRSRRGGEQGEGPSRDRCQRGLPDRGPGLLGLHGLWDGLRRWRGQSRCGGRREEGPDRGRSRGHARRRTSRGREEGQWKVEAKVHALAQEVQRLAQERDEGNRNVALLEDALERDGEEAGRLGDNKWLFGELERGNAVEAPAAAKRRNLEARLATADAGRALASGPLEEGVALLVALEQELREKAARLARRRRMKSSRSLRPRTWCCRARRGTRSCGGPSPRTSHFIGVCA